MARTALDSPGLGDVAGDGLSMAWPPTPGFDLDESSSPSLADRYKRDGAGCPWSWANAVHWFVSSTAGAEPEGPAPVVVKAIR